ncbi:hypothetical protein [Streptomyces sp. NPDC002588]|uniref:hypothetical protein n=1 Tax=Streptomyces sp. NPDC002588 TaxID=3154419 RepID=UPI00332200AE
MNHRTTAAALASCALAVAALTACGSGEPTASHQEPAAKGRTPAAATTAPATGPASASAAGTPDSSASHPAGGATTAPAAKEAASDDRTAKKGGAALPPRPDTKGEAAYVRALTAIDPDIVHDKEDQAVERGRDQCATLREFPDDREKQIGAALRRFTSPGHPDGFGRAKTTRIVDAVHTNLCPGY